MGGQLDKMSRDTDQLDGLGQSTKAFTYNDITWLLKTLCDDTSYITTTKCRYICDNDRIRESIGTSGQTRGRTL